ncbi:hypothetical protein Dimus_030678 [Dionaea muscipula]
MGIKANRNCGVAMRVWMIQLLVARGQAVGHVQHPLVFGSWVLGILVGTLRELQRLYDELIENSVTWIGRLYNF